MAQNFNNIISYIKLSFGTPYNLLELSDDELILYIKEHTLPLFSQYIPRPIWVLLNSSNQIGSSFTKHQYTYQLPDEVDQYDIVGIQEVYYNTSGGIALAASSAFFSNPTDVVISNGYFTLAQDLQTVDAFEYIPPKIITFSKESIPSSGDSLIVEVNTVHQTLDSIPSDTYQKIFKEQCLKDSIDWIIGIRSKFSNLSSPFSTLNLNIDRLQALSNSLDQKITDYYNNLPPKHLLAWLD
jgi:hypothetical protein